MINVVFGSKEQDFITAGAGTSDNVVVGVGDYGFGKVNSARVGALAHAGIVPDSPNGPFVHKKKGVRVTFDMMSCCRSA